MMFAIVYVEEGETQRVTGWFYKSNKDICLFVSLSQSEAGSAEGGPGDARLLQGRAEDDRFWVSVNHSASSQY